MAQIGKRKHTSIIKRRKTEFKQKSTSAYSSAKAKTNAAKARIISEANRKLSRIATKEEAKEIGRGLFGLLGRVTSHIKKIPPERKYNKRKYIRKIKKSSRYIRTKKSRRY